MATINYYLQKTASGLFIQYSSRERKYIKERIVDFRSNIKAVFSKEVSEVILFGSHARGTNLPRGFDGKSDIDVLVVFDQSVTAYTTETYRNQLKRFAKACYPRTPVQKSHPSVMMQMQKVIFDLVPARLQKGFFAHAYQIPDTTDRWINTNPHDFSEELKRINNRHGSIVKPIIRLFKRWNAHNDYPYAPYEFEQLIARMHFSGNSYEDAFLSVIRQLRTYRLTSSAAAKVKVLKNRGEWIETYLRRNEQDKAVEVVDKILGLVST